MGRPRKYHTPEQKRAADNAKALRYFNRNKRKINRARRRARAAAKGSNEVEATAGSQAAPARERSRLEIVCDYVRTLNTRFDRLLDGHTDLEYLTDACEKFIANSSNKSLFEIKANKIQKIQNSLKTFQDEILNLAGYGVEYRFGEDANRHMDNLSRELSRLDCEVMLEGKGFAQKFRDGCLEFQRG